MPSPENERALSFQKDSLYMGCIYVEVSQVHSIYFAFLPGNLKIKVALTKNAS